jgi:sulfur-oxidizing protein SoxX
MIQMAAMWLTVAVLAPCPAGAQALRPYAIVGDAIP